MKIKDSVHVIERLVCGSKVRTFALEIRGNDAYFVIRDETGYPLLELINFEGANRVWDAQYKELFG